MKHMLLLGAGASARAGVPTASAMTETIVQNVRSCKTSKLGYVLSFIVGHLIAEASSHGDDPFSPPDIEQVFNAVDILAYRNRREVGAFISTWDPVVREIDDADREDSIIGENIYERLKAELRHQLILLTMLTDRTSVSYLKPIVELARSQPGLVVATLNYDNAIELAASVAGVPCETGVQDWLITGQFARATHGVTLLKLHGSIDWTWETGYPPQDNPIPTKSLRYATNDELASSRYDPAVIFGTRNKLTAEGPFLDLLASFWREARETEILTVVGYSFRDVHINQYLRRWVNLYSGRQIQVIDPGFSSTAEIIRRMWESDEAFTPGLWNYHHLRLDEFGQQYQNRIHVITEAIESVPSALFS